MQLSFVPTQDRLVFRLNTKSRQEFRFWMTRRYVKLLWKAIMDMLQAKKRPEVRDESVRQMVIEAEHKEVVEKSDFKTEYQESTYLPLGEEPSLLFRVAMRVPDPGKEGHPVLCLHPEKGEGIEIALNEQILHSLCKLLAETTQKAEWGLDLDFAQAQKYFPGQGLN